MMITENRLKYSNCFMILVYMFTDWPFYAHFSLEQRGQSAPLIEPLKKENINEAT